MVHVNRFVNLHRGDEAIAKPWQRLNVTRLCGGFVEDGAKFADRGVEAMLKIYERVRGPELAAKLFPGHYVARPAQQQVQYLQRLRANLKLYAMFVEFTAAGARFVWAELKNSTHGLKQLTRDRMRDVRDILLRIVMACKLKLTD